MTTYGPYQATVVKIHDGDTLDVDLLLFRAGKVAAGHEVDLGFNVWRTAHGTMIRNQAVRLYGCNAAELTTPAGKAALAYLETILHVDDVVTLVSHSWDKYGGRIDGDIGLRDGRDLATVMIAAGQAAPWDGHGVKPVPANA